MLLGHNWPMCSRCLRWRPGWQTSPKLRDQAPSRPARRSGRVAPWRGCISVVSVAMRGAAATSAGSGGDARAVMDGEEHVVQGGLGPHWRLDASDRENVARCRRPV
jgi:hypothetical protein